MIFTLDMRTESSHIYGGPEVHTYSIFHLWYIYYYASAVHFAVHFAVRFCSSLLQFSFAVQLCFCNSLLQLTFAVRFFSSLCFCSCLASAQSHVL